LHALDTWPNTLDDSKRDWLLEQGFVPPNVMARKCVECHVGASDREVNHDLIAAGHPELKFEFSKGMTAFPKHWRIKSQTESQKFKPQTQTQQLKSGQQANALAFLELVNSRLTRNSVSPEFSEFHCRSCHHSIGQFSSPTEFANNGVPRWADWQFANLADAKFGDDAKTALDDLRSIMENSDDETPREHIVKKVDALRERLQSPVDRQSDVKQSFNLRWTSPLESSLPANLTVSTKNGATLNQLFEIHARQPVATRVR